MCVGFLISFKNMGFIKNTWLPQIGYQGAGSCGIHKANSELLFACGASIGEYSNTSVLSPAEHLSTSVEEQKLRCLV